jgi:hypothetical protein
MSFQALSFALHLSDKGKGRCYEVVSSPLCKVLKQKYENLSEKYSVIDTAQEKVEIFNVQFFSTLGF